MRLSAVFDMDGVIVDNRAFHFRAWKIFSSEHGLPFDETFFRDRLFGRTNAAILRGLFGRELAAGEAAGFAEAKEALYRRIYRGHVRPAPGLEEFLKDLRAKGATTAVATAAPRANLDFALDETGLGPLFDVLVDIDMVPNGKPAPDLYLKAAELLGRPPERCVAFEDSYPGLRSALAAGMKVVGVTTTHSAGEIDFAHRVIADFRDIDASDLERLIG
jgi:beta-phosphoglucomutase